MGSLTVEEYYHNFLELMRFFPTLVPNEEHRIQKFEQGLTVEIQRAVCGDTFSTLEALFNKVARVYDLDKLQSQKNAMLKRKGMPPPTPVNPKRPIPSHLGATNFQNQRNSVGFSTRPEAIDRFTLCRYFQRSHFGEDCQGNKIVYFICGKPGHRAFECTHRKYGGYQTNNATWGSRQIANPRAPQAARGRGRNGSEGLGRGRNGRGHLFAIRNDQERELSEDVNIEEHETQEDMVTGTFSINSIFCYVLFDTGATNSFISTSAVKCLELQNPQITKVQISLPSGNSMPCSSIFKNVNIIIENINFPSNLFVIDLQEFDVILGMDFLSKYNAIVDCRRQRVQLNSPSEKQLVYHKSRRLQEIRIVSALQLVKYLQKGHWLFLCNVEDLSKPEGKSLKDIPIVQEFEDIFPEEIP